MSGPLATALAFARHEIATVPIWPIVEREGRFVCGCGKKDCNSPGKHPIAQLNPPRGPKIAPNGALSATTETGILKHWFGDLVPAANLAAATSNLIVLDIDVRHDGLASFARLESENGKLPDTWSVVTGGGGAHHYFRRPSHLELNLPIIAGNIIKNGGSPPFGPGIDIPSYVLTPPSRHVCGRHYEWDNHPADIELAEAPGWMIERLIDKGSQSQGGATPARDWEIRTGHVFGPNDYPDAELAAICGKLLRAISLPSGFVMELLSAWNSRYCDPPLHEHEVRRIFDRVARSEIERLESEET